MKKSFIKKLIITITSVLIVSLAVGYFYIKSEIKHHQGVYTEQVDFSKFNVSQSSIAITNVNVLSQDCSEMKGSLTVLIKDGIILDVGKNIEITSAYKKIDGSGKFLIPGLIDAHTHLHRSKNDLLLFLANGVTSIANMNSKPDQLYLKWRKEANEGALSPRIYIAAGGMSSKKGFMAKMNTIFGSRYYNTEEEARQAIREFKKLGYDAIKSYAPNREAYYAIMDEAQKQGIPVTGHLPLDVGLQEFYTSGQSALAHAEEITKNTFEDFGGLNYIFYDRIDEYMQYLEENADKIAQNLKKNNITVCSTVRYIENIHKQATDLPKFLKEIELEYANPGIVEGSHFAKGWLPGSNKFESPGSTTENKNETADLYWSNYVKAIHIMTKALVDNDVKLTSGADTNGFCTVSGFSLHDQLASLEEIGLTITQVLRTSTITAAQWMQHNTGVIEKGFAADLVLLDKNPLEDIDNTRTIQAVITNGKYLDRTTLDNMLLAVKEANARSRNISINAYLN
ncbi:amidohydrolase family protein [Kordia sp.]|uniref:amidohydrolase family protein n=1 Tax=Kordia sp. TaxID=1965332 RepID=UPI003B5BB090